MRFKIAQTFIRSPIFRPLPLALTGRGIFTAGKPDVIIFMRLYFPKGGNKQQGDGKILFNGHGLNVGRFFDIVGLTPLPSAPLCPIFQGKNSAGRLLPTCQMHFSLKTYSYPNGHLFFR